MSKVLIATADRTRYEAIYNFCNQRVKHLDARWVADAQTAINVIDGDPRYNLAIVDKDIPERCNPDNVYTPPEFENGNSVVDHILRYSGKTGVVILPNCGSEISTDDLNRIFSMMKLLAYLDMYGWRIKDAYTNDL